MQVVSIATPQGEPKIQVVVLIDAYECGYTGMQVWDGIPYLANLVLN